MVEPLHEPLQRGPLMRRRPEAVLHVAEYQSDAVIGDRRRTQDRWDLALDRHYHSVQRRCDLSTSCVRVEANLLEVVQEVRDLLADRAHR